MNDTIESNCAIVTGGGHGLGRAIAERLANDLPVVIVGRERDSLLATKHTIEEHGGVAEIVCGDVRDNATLTECSALIDSLNWHVNTLVCNAGIGKSSATPDVTDEIWNDIISTNLTSVHSWCRAFCPSMLEAHRGTVVLISSVAGLKGVAYDTAYSASKHALVGLGQSMALEYGKQGVAVQIVCPGYIDGEMTSRSISGLAERHGISQDEARAILAKQNPMREVMSPTDVADVVAFLCTEPGHLLAGNPVILGATA